jgi:secernin
MIQLFPYLPPLTEFLLIPLVSYTYSTKDHEKVTESFYMNAPRYDKKPYQRSSVSSVCMHGGFVYGDQTTGSYIASLGDPINTYWVTGSSAPCLSLFKPLWLVDDERVTFREDKIDGAVSYWIRQEELHRSILEQRLSVSDYKIDRDQLEKSLIKKVQSIRLDSTGSNQLSDIMAYALSEEKKLQDCYLAQAKSSQPTLKGNLYFNHYWEKVNRKFRNLC